MKTILAFLLLTVTSSCTAQQKTDLELSYLFYYDGYHVVSVKATGNCDPVVRLSWYHQAGVNRDTFVLVKNGSTVMVHLQGKYVPGISIKAMSTAPCASTNWEYATIPDVLDVNFVSFRGRRIGVFALLEYELYFSDPGDAVVLERSANATAFKPVHTIATEDERSFKDFIPDGAYYRLKTKNKYGTYDYSKVVYVPPAEKSLAAVFHLYDYHGREIGVFRKWDRLPRGNYIAKSAFETHKISVQ